MVHPVPLMERTGSVTVEMGKYIFLLKLDSQTDLTRFLGYHCELSICDNNPCLFGGTCIPFSNSGYICLCPYGKHGHFCENSKFSIISKNFVTS